MKSSEGFGFEGAEGGCSRVDVKTRIDTDKYFASHLKAPRGMGRCAFCPSKAWGTANYLDHVFWFNGTYGEAKRAAIAHFSAKGVKYAVACP